jgi:hypothetical protein
METRTATARAWIFAGAILCSALGTSASIQAHNPAFTRDFDFGSCGGFLARGRNPYFILETGYRLLLAGTDDGEPASLQITVLPQTIQIAGVTAAIVEEREVVGGRLVEISLNYFVICKRNNNVIYLGEDVDIFNDDGSVTHEGEWRAGRNGASAGVIMPGTVLIGARYFQEIAPGVALDRAEIVSLSAIQHTPAGRFTCLKTEESTPLEPGATEFKYYARNVGLVREQNLRLVFATGLK